MQLTEKEKFDLIISSQENMKNWHTSLNEAPTLMQVHARFYDLIASHNEAQNSKTGVLPAGSMPPSEDEMIAASLRLAPWLAAAIDDPDVCDEYKLAISGWFNTSMPTAVVDLFHSKILDANAILEEEIEKMVSRADSIVPNSQEEIEKFFKMAGARWNGVVWEMTDDDLAPLTTAIVKAFGKPDAPIGIGDWKGTLYAAMDLEFNRRNSDKRDADGQRVGMVIDDTQLGVEFAMSWFEKNMPLSWIPQMLGGDYVHTIASECGMYEQHDNAKPSADTVLGFAQALYDAIMSNAAIHAAAKVKS